MQGGTPAEGGGAQHDGRYPVADFGGVSADGQDVRFVLQRKQGTEEQRRIIQIVSPLFCPAEKYVVQRGIFCDLPGEADFFFRVGRQSDLRHSVVEDG